MKAAVRQLKVAIQQDVIDRMVTCNIPALRVTLIAPQHMLEGNMQDLMGDNADDFFVAVLINKVSIPFDELAICTHGRLAVIAVYVQTKRKHSKEWIV
jgi:hypothetical protein